MMKLTKSSRAFRRATAFILAAAMTLSAPVATQASAASKKKVPSLSVKKKTLYYNKAGKKSFTLKIKKNKVKKIVKTKWTTSKKSVVKISAKKKTKVKVTAIKKGSAKIKAKVTYRVKAGSKAKTKTLTCKVTSKKQSKPAPATETPATSGTPATDVPSAEPTTEPSAEPTEEPADATATGTSISAVDPSAFEFTVTLQDGKNNEAAVKNAKLELKKGSISATASFKGMDGANVAVFAVDEDSKKALKPGDRSADGKYDVTTSSKALTLPADAYTTYEEAIAALAVEGFVTTPVYDADGSFQNKYAPVAGATVTLIEGGKTTTTDSNGYYRLATSSGKKTMKVENEGYISQVTGADAIVVNKSQLTSQNFVLATFKQDQVHVDITVKDSKDNSAVDGATVKLLDEAGKEVVGTKTNLTDAGGKSVFANKDGDITHADGHTDNYDQADADPKEVYLEKGKTYTVEVEKALKSDNMTDVYKKNTAKITIEAKHDHNVTIKLDKVAELSSLKIKSKYDNSTEEDAKVPANRPSGVPEAPDAHTVYNQYYLLANTGEGNDNIADVLSNGATGATLDALGQKDSTLNASGETEVDLVTGNLLNLSTAKPTLPSGTYYVLVKGYKTAAYAGGSAPTDGPTSTAYSVVEFKVEEGKDVTVNVQRSPGCTQGVETNVGLTRVNSANQTTTTGQALKNIVRTTPGDQNTAYQLGGTGVTALNTLFQKMTGNVLVKVEDSDVANPGLTVNYTEDKVYSAVNEYTHLLEQATYVVRSESNYAEAADNEFSVNRITNQRKLIAADSRFKIVTLTIKVQDGDALIGKTAPTGNNALKIKKIRILDSTGKELDSKEYPDWALAEASGPSKTLAADDLLTFDTSIDSELYTPDSTGGKVKIEVTLKDCNPVTSGEIAVSGLEDLQVAITQKVTPVAGRTALSGTVSILQKTNNETKLADDVDNVNTGNLVQVILYKDGKIAGVGQTDANGKYEIRESAANKLEAGDYKLVARGYSAETYVTTVTLKNQETVTQDLTMNEGAKGSAKVVITDTNKNAILNGGVRVVAYDSNYVNAGWKGSWVSDVVGPFNANLFGRYGDADVMVGNNTVGASDVKSKTERQLSNLSVGSYTLHFYEANEFDAKDDVFAYENQTMVLSTNGESKRPDYSFSPKNVASGDGKVDLRVNHPTSDSTRVVVVKMLDENGNETDQIEAIDWFGRASATYTEAGAASVLFGAGGYGHDGYSVVRVTPHKTYNVYVYDFTGHYVAKVVKNVEGVAAQAEIGFRNAQDD